jgi:hypothetical protein
MAGTSLAANPERAAQVFKALTLSAPNAVFDAEAESTPIPPPAQILAATPTPIVGAQPQGGGAMRWIALGATAVALIAASIAGTLIFLSTRPSEVPVREAAIAPPPTPPPAPADPTPAPPDPVPQPPPVVQEPTTFVQQAPQQPEVEPPAQPARGGGHRRGGQQGRPRVVDGVPIVGW